MKSMTGFGQAIANFEDFDISIDITSINKKGFEFSSSLPYDWVPMEKLILAKVKKFFQRGKIHVACRLNNKTSNALSGFDETLIKSNLKALKNLSENLEIEFKPSFELLLKLSDNAKLPNQWENYWEKVEIPLEEALNAINKMRQDEANSLEIDFIKRLDFIASSVEKIQSISKENPKRYKELLLQRLKNLNLDISSDDERLLKEICIFADKCDISEEITRIYSHIDQFKKSLKLNETIGRKLDFICQELSREINTTASKANNIEITKITIDLKNELERIREQVQNIE